MKGVFGLADTRNFQIEVSKTLSSMVGMMSHLPWQEVDLYTDEYDRVGIGRLGIGKFNSVKQPVFSEDGGLVLCMAGEFYNLHKARLGLQQAGFTLREGSDAEIALRLYEKEGKNFVKSVEGIFVIAIWDRLKETLLLLNDRFGLYPCYYSQTVDQLIFAPSANAVADASEQIKILDLTALSQYMRFQHMLGSRTFYENVHLLSPASILEYQPNRSRLTIRKYWDFDEMPPIRNDISFEEAATEAGRLLRKAVEKRYRHSHFPIGVYLSGGMDSRTIVGMIDREARPRIHTLTFGKKDSRDVYYAGRIAKKMGTRHHWFDLADGRWVLDHVDLHLKLTEGFHSWIHSHGISTLESARGLIGVNLSGLGGGLVMAGSDIQPTLANAPDDIAWTAGLFDFMTQSNTWPSLTEAEEELLYCEKFYESYIKDQAFNSFREEVAKARHLDKQRRTEFFTWEHADRKLFQMYTVFFGAFIENRYPFYDYDLFEFVFSLPLEYRRNYRLYRAVLQREEPSLTWIPYDKDERLPTSRSWVRKAHAVWKRGLNKLAVTADPSYSGRETLYADYENYLRSDLKPWAKQLLLNKTTFERGYFRPESIYSLLERHLSGHEEWTIGKIAPLMTFEMVMRKFFDRVIVY